MGEPRRLRRCHARALRRVTHWHTSAAQALDRLGAGDFERHLLEQLAETLRQRALKVQEDLQATTPATGA